MRIIAGKFKKQQLLPPKGNDTRPTTDRVRESAFNILEHTVLENGFHELSCLDAFAGSGALGLEALSRGAKSCFFVEKNKNAFQTLCGNYKKILHVNHTNDCLNKDILELRADKKFDLVFLDPPFASIDLYEKTITHLNINEMIHSESIIYVESDAKKNMNFDQIKIIEKIYGSIKIMFFKKKIM